MTNYHNIGGAVTLGAFGGEIIAVITDLRWMIIFCIALILVDFWWGWQESTIRKKQAVTRVEKEKHKFRFSLAGRRTLNKVVDYMSYILIGVLAGLAITEPIGLCNHNVTAAIGLGLGCIFEVSSIIGHVCYVKGWNIRINWKKLIVAILKFKWKELANVFEEAVDELEENDVFEKRPLHKHTERNIINERDYEDMLHHCGYDTNKEIETENEQENDEID